MTQVGAITCWGGGVYQHSAQQSNHFKRAANFFHHGLTLPAKVAKVVCGNHIVPVPPRPKRLMCLWGPPSPLYASCCCCCVFCCCREKRGLPLHSMQCQKGRLKDSYTVGKTQKLLFFSLGQRPLVSLPTSSCQ